MLSGRFWSSSNAAGKPFSVTSSEEPVLFWILNKSPVPSSLIVAMPIAETPASLATINLKVSLLSKRLSLVIDVRTSKVVLALGIAAKEFAV